MILGSIPDLPHLSRKSYTSSFYRLRLASFLPVGPEGLEDEMPCVVDSAAKALSST